MEVLEKEVFKGIEYIRIQKLTPASQEKIKNYLKPGELIKILTPEGIMPDCVCYSIYIQWVKQSNQQLVASSEKETDTSTNDPIAQVPSLRTAV